MLREIIRSTSDRRHFLRGGNAWIALPALTSLTVDGGTLSASSHAKDGPSNFVAIGTYLGWHQNAFYPSEVGREGNWWISETGYVGPLSRQNGCDQSFCFGFMASAYWVP